MKHPVLRIKKGAEVYDDASSASALSSALRARERARHAVEETPPPRGRRVRAAFFPLLVVALALFAVYHFTPHGPRDRATINGWQTILRATPNNSELIIGVTFIAPSAGEQVGTPFARAHVSLPDTGATLELSGALTKSPMTLRGELPYSLAVRRVVADVSVGARSARLMLTSRAAR